MMKKQIISKIDPFTYYKKYIPSLEISDESAEGISFSHSYKADVSRRYVGLDYIRELITKGEI